MLSTRSQEDDDIIEATTGNAPGTDRRAGLFRSWGRRDWVGAFVLTAIYLATVLFFPLADVHDGRFFAEGGGGFYLAYQVVRVVFVGYFLWLHYFLGRLVLGVFERRGVNFFAAGEGSGQSVRRFVLAFFTGGAALHVVMLPLGYLNLYHGWLALAATVLMVAASWGEWKQFQSLVRTDLGRVWSDNRPVERASLILLFAGSVVAVLFLFVMKGLSPGIDHDAITHYLPYYRAVIESHGIWPNDVWYHYFFTKGAGGIFAGMLLTDPMGGQLTSLMFYLAAAAALYDLARRAVGSRHWALLGVTLFLAGVIFTAGWGAFEKQHIIMTGMLGGLAWLLATIPGAPPQSRWAWTILGCLWAAGLVIFVSTITALVCVVCGILGIVAFAVGQRSLFVAYATIGIGAATVALAVIAHNYLATGIGEVTPFRVFWDHADRARFAEWISPYLMILLEEGSGSSMGRLSPPDLGEMNKWDYWAGVFRLDAVRFLVPRRIALWVAGAGIVLVIGFRRRLSADQRRIFWVVAAVLAGGLGLGQIMNQPISMSRYFVFTIFFVVLLAVAFWGLVVAYLIPAAVRLKLTAVATVAVMGWCLYKSIDVIPEYDLQDRAAFATGRLSLAEFYASRNALWEPAIEAQRVAGAGERIWLFNINRYCLSPEARLETNVSFSLHPRWHDIMFGEPEEAKQLLSQGGVNFFLLDLSTWMFDIFPASPLFHPDSIRDHMEIAWAEDGVYLLGWKGNGGTPIDDKFMDAYLASIESSNEICDWPALYERLKLVYEKYRGTSLPVHKIEGLPPVKGWQ